jgi:cysteine desulfurase
MAERKKTKLTNLPIQLDNNATTRPSDGVLKEFENWSKKFFNPASSSKYAKSSKNIIEKARNYIAAHCGVNGKYTVLFTSGASESNCTAIRSCVVAYAKHKNPHIVCSAIEHHSIISCIEALQLETKLEVSWIKPTIRGQIDPEKVAEEIKQNTCLVIVMFANNETGAINDIPTIGEVCRKHGVPLLSDMVQIFGKAKINLDEKNIDIATVSFHKFHGFVGSGLLIINNDVISGYKLHGIINGTQQNGLRGGTESVPLIASSLRALIEAFSLKDRKKKNTYLNDMRTAIIESLKQRWTFTKIENLYAGYIDNVAEKKPIFVVIGPEEKGEYLPNTLMLCFINPLEVPYIKKPSAEIPENVKFCNVKLKNDLDKMGFMCSIASACLTEISHASHVIQSMDPPACVNHGILRISMSDMTVKAEIKYFIPALIQAVEKQIK